MKRKITLLLVLTLVFGLSACGKDKDATLKDDTNLSSEQKETDNLVNNDKEDVLDEKPEDIQEDNSDKPEDEVSNTQSTTDTTDSSNTTSDLSTDDSPNDNSSNSTAANPNANTQTNTHKHSYSAATCTSPPKCSCGATEGVASGHNYSNATCTQAQKCSVCGATSGNSLGHDYDVDGICTRCTTKDPNFVYPTASSMDGTWRTMIEFNSDGHFVAKLTLYFDVYGKGTIDCGEWEYYLVENLPDDYGPLDEAESIMWNNQRYYRVGGGMLLRQEATYSETSDKITIIDGYNQKMILQRTSTNTMEVTYVDPGFGDGRFSINTIVTFYN